MDLDLISVLLGAGLALVSGLIGAPIALLLRRPPSEPDPYTCGCGHALAHHDPETNRCAASVEITLYGPFNEPSGRERKPCACRQYVGERPVDPEAVLDKFINDRLPVAEPTPQDRT